MFMRVSTHNENMRYQEGIFLKTLEERDDMIDVIRKSNCELADTVARLENRRMRDVVKISSYEKRLKIRTGYWKDKTGRWRHPKTGRCVKASIVMEVQLRSENKAELKRKEADNAYKKVRA